MSKYPCDNWSWSSRRRGDPRLRDHDANKENREPISPLSRLAEKVDDSRRWAPIPDRWHNHCEWLVNHHRNLRKRFRRTTANDRLAGVLTTLQCTQERRRGSDEDESVVGRGSRCKRSSDVEYPELEPASIWLGSVHSELLQLEKEISPPKVQPFSEEGDEMEVETQKSEQDLKADDVDCNPTKPNPSTEYDESTVERVKTSTATATRSTFRSPSPVEGAFEPEDFRTSTPTADERSRRDPEEPCASFRRSSAWKDYVMSHNPILFRSYVNTQYPKRSWRHSHQKVAARHCGKYRRSSSGRIRKPPTPKSLRISWNSLDDVVRNEGILRSPLRLPSVLPGDVTPPTNPDNDQGVDVQLDDNLSANDSHADVDMNDVIGDGIRAIRKDCRARYQSANDSYAASDERDVESSVDPGELSDISYGEEDGESTDKHDYDLEDVSSDDDIEDICRIVDKELHHDDYHPDDILSEISFDILDDLDVDSKYPPNYFRAGFADRAVRRRKIKKVMRMINKLDPQARSFKPRYKHEEDNGDQRIVKFADCETSDDSRDKEKMEVACESGTKFYPSDVRFIKKHGVKKVGESPKASAHKHAESKAVIPLSVPVPVKRVDSKRELGKNVKECGSLKNIESEVKKGNGDDQEQCLEGEVCKTVESERPVPKPEAGLMADAEKNEKTPSIKPILKGKVKRQVAHKISVVMGRRPGKPSQAMENRTGDDDGRSVSRSLAAGEDDNGGVMPKRIPQLRQIEMIHQGNVNAVDKEDKRPSSGENVKTDGTVSVKFTAENVTFEAKAHKNAARMEGSVQSRALQFDPTIRSIDVNQSRYSAKMKQRLTLLKESYGNSPTGAAGLVNLTDCPQEQLDSKINAVAKGVTSNECGQPRMAERHELGHRDVELPGVNNNRIANNVPQAKINPLSTFADAGNNDEIDKGKGISDLSSVSQQNELSCTETCPAKVKQPESLVNVDRAMPLQSEQKEVGRGSGNPLSETGRENHPPQPLIQNPPHRFPHPQPHHNMNPNVHPNMHPNMRVMPGNAPLYKHPPDQQHPFNPNFSAYHHHQMALRTAAMHYYNQQRHMVLQRHPPGFHPPRPHHVNMHPGYRPEWNMPGPGPGPPR